MYVYTAYIVHILYYKGLTVYFSFNNTNTYVKSIPYVVKINMKSPIVKVLLHTHLNQFTTYITMHIYMYIHVYSMLCVLIEAI